MGRSPAAARRRLGAELRDLRVAAGKKIDDAAQVLQCSNAKISRLENGKGVPFERDVRDLIEAYGEQAQERQEELFELVSEGRAQDWFSDFSDVFYSEMNADHLHRLFELERDAAVMKVFEAELFPGLLQRESYIGAVCSIVFPERSESERKRFIDFRLKRQEVLLRHAPPPQLSFIVSELALVPRVGGVTVMRDQLAGLVAELTGRLSFIDFRLAPLTVEAHGVFGGPFTIMRYADTRDQDVVYLEGREGATYLENDRDVERYENIFTGLEHDSLTREASINRLVREIDSLVKPRS